MADPEGQAAQEPLTLEQLNSIVSDPESEKKVSQAQQLPVGTYNSTPPLKRDIARAKNTGRAYARYFGEFKGTGDVVAAHGFASFAVSWEDKFKEDGKPDLMTKLYGQAKRAYRLVMGLEEHAPVAVGPVLEFLEKYAISVRFLQGDDDNMAVAISKVKEG